MKRPRHVLPLLVSITLACLAIGPGCGKRPTSQDLSTPYADEDLGRKSVEEMGPKLGIIASGPRAAYIDEIGQRLARNAPGHPFDYEFRLVDQDEPNAFAIPGGFVFVSRGALLFSNTEDELAGVIGHEIAHVASRHAAAHQQVGASSPILQLLQTPWLTAYSRDLERAADRIGQDLAAASGYDPAGLVGFLRGLDGLERVTTGTFRINSFYATHPGTRERAAEAAQRAEQIQWVRQPGFSTDAAAHLRRLEGLVVGDSGEQGVFEGSRFMHPDMGFTLRFPDGWATANTPAAVGAISPAQDAQVFVELGGTGDNAAQAAEKWIGESQQNHVRVDRSEPIRLVGREAWRVTGGVRAQGVPLSMVVTFIPWRGQIMRCIGVAESSHYAPIFVSVARSFRAMTPELMARVSENRVQIVEARAGERLSALSKRTENTIPLLKMAVMNGWQGDQTLNEGQLVKIAVRVPYRPAGAADPATDARSIGSRPGHAARAAALH